MKSNEILKTRVLGAVLGMVLVVGGTLWGAGTLLGGREEANAAGGQDLTLQGVKVEPLWARMSGEDALKHAELLLREQDVLVPYFVNKYRVPEDRVKRIVESAQIAGFVHGIDYKLILGMVEQESSFREDVGNWYGAVGLMQVVPRFHSGTIASVTGIGDKRKQVEVLKEGDQNVRVGTEVLSQFADRSRNQLRKTLARYSGGAKNYVEKVNRYRVQMAAVVTRELAKTPVEGGNLTRGDGDVRAVAVR